MTAWRLILHKDFRLGLPWLGLGIIVVATGNVFAAALLENPMYRFIAAGILAGAHILYFPVFLGMSLGWEGRRFHQWLHSPRPGWQLLLSKVLNALAASILSLSVSLLYPAYLVHRFPELRKLLESMDWGGITYQCFSTSISFGFLVMFLWTIKHVLKNLIGPWNNILFIALFVTVLTFQIQFHNESNGQEISVHMQLLPPLTTESLLIDLGIWTALFLMTAWLLDRRTEV